jgi:hypothetical protein
MKRLVEALDGEIEVALLCGSSEPSDPAYKRCTVEFRNGENVDRCEFGPYQRNFRQPITGFCLYFDDEKLEGKLTAHRPSEAEVSVFEPGSLKVSING